MLRQVAACAGEVPSCNRRGDGVLVGQRAPHPSPPATLFPHRYKELKEVQKTKNELKKTMTRAAEGSTFEERLAALGLKEPAADGAAAPASAPAPAPAAPAPAASPSSAWSGAAAEPAPTQTRRRPRTFFGAEDLVIDDGAEDEPEAPPPPADEPPPQSGRTRCVAANDLVLDECGDEL